MSTVNPANPTWRPTTLAAPYAGLRDEHDLAKLSYFDSLACLGELSLHCGGIANTGELLCAAEVGGGTRVLEIGCGTGATTRAMVRAGLDVTAIDPLPRMIATMQRNCLMHAGRMPENHVASAESMPMFAAASFDVVLLECVFGFIPDKAAAISEMYRVLKPGGRVAITDFNYIKAPSDNLKARLAEEFDLREILTRADWEKYFSAFELQSWEETPMGNGGITPDSIRMMLEDAKLDKALPGGALGVHTLAKRFRAWDDVFDENRTCMAGHNAIWRKPIPA